MGQCACGVGQSSGRASGIDRFLDDSNDGVKRPNGSSTSTAASTTGKQDKGAKSSKSAKKNRRVETKLLLLGTGNSGKSTVFKQFQLLHRNGFLDEERDYYRTLMAESTIATIRKLVQNANDMLFDGEIKDGELNERDIMLLIKKQKKIEKMRDENNVTHEFVTHNIDEPVEEDKEEEDDIIEFSEFIGAGDKNKSNRKKQHQQQILKSSSNGGGGGGNNLTNKMKVGREPQPSDLSEASSIGRRTDLSEFGRLKRAGSSGLSQQHHNATVIADDLAHLVDIVKTLPENTMLYEKFPVTVQVESNGNIEEEEIEMPVSEMLKLIWDDPVIQRVYSMESKIPSLEAPIEYYMDNIDRIASKDFIPTEDDILHARKQTRQVQQLKFKLDGKNFVLTDVGGQRSQRKDWINYFNDVDAILYIVGLDGYNQYCIEDGKTNRLRESLQLFKSICESPYFTETNILLFLNKSDIYKEKIKQVPLNYCFKSYNGPQHDFDKTLQYIHKRFEDTHTRHITKNLRVDALPPKIYPHVTCATATEQMRFIIIACQSIFLRQGMAQCGIATM